MENFIEHFMTPFSYVEKIERIQVFLHIDKPCFAKRFT